MYPKATSEVTSDESQIEHIAREVRESLETNVSLNTREMISKTLYDTFGFYANKPDTSSTLERASCIGMCAMVAERFRSSETFPFKDIDVRIIPCDVLEFASSTPLEIPFEHATLLFTHRDIPIGVTDPSYGLYDLLPLHKSTTIGKREIIFEDSPEGLSIKLGGVGEPMNVILHPELNVTSDNIHSLLGLQKNARDGAMSCIISEETGLKLNKLKVDSKSISHVDFEGNREELPLSGVTGFNDVDRLVAKYVAEVNSHFSAKGISLDLESMQDGVMGFIKFRRNKSINLESK